MEILKDIRTYRMQLKEKMKTTNAADTEKLDKEAAALENTPRGNSSPSFSRLVGTAASLFGTLQESDMPATPRTVAAVAELKKQFDLLVTKWSELKTK